MGRPPAHVRAPTTARTRSRQVRSSIRLTSPRGSSAARTPRGASHQGGQVPQHVGAPAEHGGGLPRGAHPRPGEEHRARTMSASPGLAATDTRRRPVTEVRQATAGDVRTGTPGACATGPTLLPGCRPSRRGPWTPGCCTRRGTGSPGRGVSGSGQGSPGRSRGGCCRSVVSNSAGCTSSGNLSPAALGSLASFTSAPARWAPVGARAVAQRAAVWWPRPRRVLGVVRRRCPAVREPGSGSRSLRGGCAPGRARRRT